MMQDLLGMFRISIFILRGSKQASGDMIRFVFFKDRLAMVIENGSGGMGRAGVKQETCEKPM